MTRIGSLCSGVGGLDLAVEALTGGQLDFFAEVDRDASTVLAAHWPDVPNLGDITTVDWRAKGHLAGYRNDDLAQAMYDRYCQGLSVQQVAKEFDRSRQSVWKMLSRRGWDLRQRPPARPTVEYRGRKFSLRDNGYYAATDGAREQLHRIIWADHHGTPPPADYDIHHKDHDKTNNDPSNLECLPKCEHARTHGTGCNGYVHRCAGVVKPDGEPVVDVLTAGFPRSLPARESGRATKGDGG